MDVNAYECELDLSTHSKAVSVGAVTSAPAFFHLT